MHCCCLWHGAAAAVGICPLVSCRLCVRDVPPACCLLSACTSLHFFALGISNPAASEDIGKLPYLRQTSAEAMRLYPQARLRLGGGLIAEGADAAA